MTAVSRAWSCRPIVRGALLLLSMAGVLSLSATTAGAEVVEDAVTGVVVRTDRGPVAQAIAIQGIYPGSQHETVFFLEGSRTSTIQTVALAVTNVRDLENTCNRPERNTLDGTCGSGQDQGELSEFLELHLASGLESITSGVRSCIVDTPAIGGQPLQEAGDLVVERPAAADDDVVCLAATFRHAVKGPSDNLTQTDSVLFDLELRFEGEGLDETDVAGVATNRGAPRTLVPSAVVSGGGTLSLGLAATGAPVLVLLGVALGLLGTGVLVRTLTRGGTT